MWKHVLPASPREWDKRNIIIYVALSLSIQAVQNLRQEDWVRTDIVDIA